LREVRRAELVAAIGKPCAYCGDPRSKGGTLAPHNKVLACDPCNQDKGSRSLASWLYRLRKADDQRAVFVATTLATQEHSGAY
jgi:hypothetical protein